MPVEVIVKTVFILLVTGGLVTGLESGLAVPDWPNSFGHNMLLYPISEMKGGSVLLGNLERFLAEANWARYLCIEFGIVINDDFFLLIAGIKGIDHVWLLLGRLWLLDVRLDRCVFQRS